MAGVQPALLTLRRACGFNAPYSLTMHEYNSNASIVAAKPTSLKSSPKLCYILHTTSMLASIRLRGTVLYKTVSKPDKNFCPVCSTKLMLLRSLSLIRPQSHITTCVQSPVSTGMARAVRSSTWQFVLRRAHAI